MISDVQLLHLFPSKGRLCETCWTSTTTYSIILTHRRWEVQLLKRPWQQTVSYRLCNLKNKFIERGHWWNMKLYLPCRHTGLPSEWSLKKTEDNNIIISKQVKEEASQRILSHKKCISTVNFILSHVSLWAWSFSSYRVKKVVLKLDSNWAFAKILSLTDIQFLRFSGLYNHTERYKSSEKAGISHYTDSRAALLKMYSFLFVYTEI